MARHLYVRIGGQWFVDAGTDVAPDRATAATRWRKSDGPPPKVAPTPTDVPPAAAPTAAAPPPTSVPPGPADAKPLPEEHAMTFDTISALAKTMSPAVAGDVIPLIAAGLRLKFPNAKPTLEADLQTEVAALQATYAAVAAAEASTKALLADLK